MSIIRRARRIVDSLGGRRPVFGSSDVVIGHGVRFGRNVTFNCDRVRIGDGVIFGSNIRVDCSEFSIGDFGHVYDYCFFPGPGTLRIGHNFWMGNGAIVDAAGGTDIGDNVCVGVRSQLWTHMRFGDVLMGCRFNSTKALGVGDDAWISSGCIVAPVPVETMSIALAGAVITRPMRANRCYAGVPAVDVTDKLGVPYEPLPVEERGRIVQRRLQSFAERHGMDATDRIVVVSDPAAARSVPADVTALNVADRTYTKRGTDIERAVLRFMLPDVKFVPEVSGRRSRQLAPEGTP